MLVKFFARGKGEGRGPVEYITRKNYPGTNKLRYPAPEVVRGNPVITRRLIDSLSFKHKYNSGVLSFAPSDAPTDKQIEAVIDSFERYAFAGLKKDAYNTLWVKHTHTGNERVELHFITPRVELYTGKSLNIAPPGWHGYFKPWQSEWNIREGWARPDDPARQRDYEPGFQALINADRQAKGLEPIKDTRKLLTELVTERIEARLISDRRGIVEFLTEELGLDITRAGEKYITVKNSEMKKGCRLKGNIYEREFGSQRQTTAEVRTRETSNSRDNSKELRQVRARIRSNYKYRTQYHRERYKVSKLYSDKDVGQILANTSRGRVEPLSGFQYRRLGDNAILVESDRSKTENIRLSEPESQFSRSQVTRASTDFGVNRGEDSRNNNYPDGQRNISDFTDELESNSWLAMPGKTLSEIGVGVLKDTPSDIDHERTRKQTNDRFGEVVAAVQAGHDRFIPQVQHGHESAGKAEQAATISGDALKQSSQELERANRSALFIQQQTDFNLDRIGRALKKRRVKQLERFKTEINLVEYAMSYGYEYIEAKSTHNKAILSHESGDKIVVVKDESDRYLYFSFQDDWDKGTIIDFLQHRCDLNLGEVRKELRPWLNQRDNAIAPPQPMSDERISLIQEFLEFSVLKSHPYLAELGISDSTSNSDRFIGRIAVDEKNHLIFPHYDHDGITGYEIKNDGKKSFNKSETKALWQSNQQSDDTRLVITKTAIDALSYHQLFPDQHTRYISTEGMSSAYQRELIVEKMTELNHSHKEIIIAIDNDEVDKQLADILTSLATNNIQVKLHQPESGRTWNECLQRQIEYNRSRIQSEQKSTQNERSQLEP